MLDGAVISESIAEDVVWARVDLIDERAVEVQVRERGDGTLEVQLYTKREHEEFRLASTDLVERG